MLKGLTAYGESRDANVRPPRLPVPDPRAQPWCGKSSSARPLACSWCIRQHVFKHVHVYIYIDMNIYIYIYCMYVYIYIYVYICIMCVYMYIYTCTSPWPQPRDLSIPMISCSALGILPVLFFLAILLTCCTMDLKRAASTRPHSLVA